MSSGTAGGDESPTVDVYRREINRIERGAPVIVQYRSNRGNNSKKTRKGQVTNVKPLGTDTLKFWFYDPEAERKIEVTIRESLKESSISSQKTETVSKVGTPTLVIAGNSSETVEDLEQRHLLGKRNGEFDVVVAAAAIASNKDVLTWVKQNS